MKRTTVTTLVANMRRAIARCLDRIFVRATRKDNRSHGTSRIGDSETTGALCPDVRGGYTLFAGIVGALPALFLATTSLPAGEQDNWYLAKEWSVSESKGVFYDFNSTTGQERIFVGRGSVWDNSGRDIKLYDLNGNLLNTFGSGNFMDLTMDGNGTLYAVSHNRVLALSKSPGRIVSVTVDNNGSNLYQHWGDGEWRLEFSGGGGTGASALAVLEQNSTDTDGYNKFVTSVLVTQGGTGYSSDPNATLRSDHPKTGNTVEPQFTVNLGVGWGEDWSTGGFSKAQAIGISPISGDIFVADAQNQKIVVLDRNGTIKREFGSNGSAPGQFSFGYSQFGCSLDFLPDGTLLIADQTYLHFYKEDGTFIERTNSARYQASAASDGTIFSSSRLRDGRGQPIQDALPIPYNAFTAFMPTGDLIESYQNKIRIWKRAYRTKGLLTRNVIPQPAIRTIAQRTGTNVIDIDFEIVDPDDANATVGILAAKDGLFTDSTSWILPTAWVDGTGSKIGASIATNQVHRVSWNVKADWTEQTGTIKFEVFCQDARRNSPVDLHFLDLPLPDGNLTISRSPIKDTDFSNYFKYLLSTASSQVALENDKITDGNGNVLMETNLQASPAGKDFFMNAIGYRWAKQAELSLAREASTAGGINAWTATRQIQPRNLPKKVNEYGFDTGSHGSRAWWVVKSSTLPIPEFTTTPFDINGTQNEYFGRRVALDGKHLLVGFESGGNRKLHYYEVSESNGSLTPKSIITPDSEANSQANYFGQAFAVDGDLLAVGAREAHESGVSGVGAVYLFDLNGSSPTQIARITASDGTSQDQLGYSVDVSGNLIVAGARGEDVSGKNDVGAAYLFRKESNGSVTELAKLMHEDPQSSDYFGDAIAVGSSVVAVGAYQDDVLVSGSNKSDAGSVTLFKVDGAGNVTRAMTLIAPAPDNSAYFGSSIAISGDVLAVGEYRRNNSVANHSGRTYLYKLNADGTAQLTASINTPNPIYDGYFGYSVALDGDRLAVGAYQENSETATKPGVAYVYKVKADGSATLLEVLTHPNGKQDDRLGMSVGVSGRNVVSGASQFDPPPDKWNAGGAVLFRSSF